MDPKSKVRWGVIGSGGIARRRTIPEGIAAAANATLAAVYDPNSQVNLAVSQEFQAQACSSAQDLLNAGIDAVYVASPPEAHRDQVIACAAAGKHILCEKPLGLTVADAQAMVSASEKAGVLLGTAFMMRFHAQHQAALALIQDGKLGKPVFARAQLSCWYPPIDGSWRQDPSAGGGGSLMDMGGHCIDLLEMFFGPVCRVSCFTNRTVHPYPSEDSAVASLFFENGALGVVDAFFCMPDEASQNRLELYGSMGSILAKSTIGQGERGEMIAFLKEGAGGYQAIQDRSEQGGLLIDPTPRNMYRAEIEEFGSAIIENRQPENSAKIGLVSQKVLSACYESARTGRTIDVI